MRVLAAGRVPAPGDMGPLEWGPGRITLKVLHLLSHPHEASQTDECRALGPIQLCV